MANLSLDYYYFWKGGAASREVHRRTQMEWAEGLHVSNQSHWNARTTQKTAPSSPRFLFAFSASFSQHVICLHFCPPFPLTLPRSTGVYFVHNFICITYDGRCLLQNHVGTERAGEAERVVIGQRAGQGENAGHKHEDKALHLHLPKGRAEIVEGEDQENFLVRFSILHCFRLSFFCFLQRP
jgi:hypothetical protein